MFLIDFFRLVWYHIIGLTSAAFSPLSAVDLFFLFLWYNSGAWLVTQHGYRYLFIIIITVTCWGPRLLLFLFFNLSIKNNIKRINSIIKRINSIMLSPPHLRNVVISMPCLSNHALKLYNYSACFSIAFLCLLLYDLDCLRYLLILKKGRSN